MPNPDRKNSVAMSAHALVIVVLILLALCGLSVVTISVPAASNPSLLYSLDENQGVVVSDSSGNSNNGNLVNGPLWTSGKYNSGLNFDGGNDYVNAGSGPSIDQLPQVTAVAWIFPRTAGQFTSGDFFNKRGSNGSGWRFDISSNRLELGFSVDYSSDLYAISVPSAIPLNAWSHVAAVWDGTTAASNVVIYVNGVPVAHSLDLNGSGTRANDSNNNLIIGNNNGTDQTFDGVIDEARVYGRALTQAEIQADMNTPIGSPPAPTPSPSPTLSPSPSPTPTPPSVVGQWSAPFSTPVLVVHTTLLNTGEVLLWGAASGGSTQWLWNPTTGVFSPVSSGDNLFCSGQTVLPNGIAMSIGGHANYQVGINDINLFDPNQRSWVTAPPMSYGRWYPTGTVLGDGRVLVTSGNTTCGTCIADIPEIYDPVTSSWTQLTTAQYTQSLYPYMFVQADGRVLYAGSDEGYTPTRLLDVGSQTWTTLDATQVPGGSAVMYRVGKILKSGSIASGAVPSLSSAFVFEINQPSSWRQVGSMNEPRTYHTLSSLPDGQVLVTSGVRTATNTSSQGALSAEIWNPTTEVWTRLSSAQVKRAYHSIALLLPDGRVLVAGSGGDAAGLMTNELNAEIFSPPYLFKGPRPTITSAPTNMGHGSVYTISTPAASTIASVSLIRAGAVTHTFNNDQRYVPLTFVQNGPTALEVQIPANPNVLPPGYYLLFIVDQNGVPSIAPFVKIESFVDSQPPTDPANLTTSVSLNSVNLSWAGSTDNVAVTGYDVHRSNTSGFTPSAANRIAQVAATSHSDQGLAAGTYYYRVIARDGAGNVSGPSNQADATTTSAPVTVSFGPVASDGRVGYFGPNNSGCGQSQWNTAHAASNASPDTTNTVRSNFVSSGCQGFTAINLTRGFLSFDTSSIPDGATIVSVRLRLFITGKVNDRNDGNDFVVVVEGRQANPNSLSASDFVNAGDAITNPTEGSNRTDITSIPINAYTSWILNASAYAWISKTGFSKLALREGHDVLNLWASFTGGQGNGLHVAMSEQPGTNQDPVLEVTYVP
jgi:hypothetical protein